MIDFTGIAVAAIGAIGSILLAVATALINKNMRDSAARSQLEDALNHSLGAAQQAATLGVIGFGPKASIPGLSPEMSAGVQYVLDHAGAEAARFGITQGMLAEKISARIGLANIAVNTATASSSAPSPPPLAPLVPVAAQIAASAPPIATPPAPSIPRAIS